MGLWVNWIVFKGNFKGISEIFIMPKTPIISIFVSIRNDDATSMTSAIKFSNLNFGIQILSQLIVNYFIQ